MFLCSNSNPITIRRPIELAGKTLEWRLMNYDWKNHFQYFQHSTHTGTFNPMCWNRGESIIPHVEEEDLHYPNITESWAAENVCRRRKRKNRRRKNKTTRGRQHQDDDDVLEEDDDEDENGDEGDVMFDDQINHRTIERIDVDPLGHRHLFMPVLEGRGEGGDLYGGMEGPGAPETDPDSDLKELEKEIERDLEMELAAPRLQTLIRAANRGARAGIPLSLWGSDPGEGQAVRGFRSSLPTQSTERVVKQVTEAAAEKWEAAGQNGFTRGRAHQGRPSPASGKKGHDSSGANEGLDM
ncbi:MOXD1 2 [Chionoecetes opilio]|uniref:MOXD1 2 n=1 Tax=Chionoecetes opilio TaxID=41210 RepID=A0A8J4YG75_CHIOP|nr:MOXD1 2 [Chionoecetes opilio]